VAAIHWNKAVNGDFSTGSNWIGNTAPGAADDAVIDAIGTYTVTASQNVAVTSLEVVGGATLAIGAGKTAQAFLGGVNAGKITVADGGTFATGSLDNIGSVALNGSAKATSLEIDSVFAVFGGNGQVVLSNNANNQIIADNNTRTLDNLDDTISGAGRIGDAADTHLTLINDSSGVINANASKALTIKTGNAVINNGIMEATGSGGLHVEDIVNQLGGGTIEAVGASAHVDLDKAFIIGGTLATSGNGQIKITAGSSATLFGAVRLDGTLNVVDNSTLNLSAIVENAGTIALNGKAAATQIVVSGTSAIFEGNVTLSDNAKNAIVTDGNNQSFEVESNLSGAGTIGDSHMAFANFGTMNATGKNALILAAATTTNAGLIETTGAGHLTIAGNISGDPGSMIEALGTGHVMLKTVSIDNTKSTIGVFSSKAFLDIGTAAGAATAEIDKGTVVNVGGGQIIVGANAPASALVIKDAAVQNFGTITVADKSALMLSGSTAVEKVTNTGTIAVNGASGPTALAVDGTSGAALNGGGKVTLTDNANSFILSNGSDTILENVDNVISGAGRIGDSHLIVQNDTTGIVNATGSIAPLVINAKAFNNNGLIELTGKAGLDVQSNISNGFNGQLVAASKTGVLTIESQILGGTVATTASGATVHLDDGVLSGSKTSLVAGSSLITTAGTQNNNAGALHNAGTVNVVNNSTLTLPSAVTNIGTINIGSTGQLTELNLGTSPISGQGKIALSDDSHNLINSSQGVTVTDSSRLLTIAGTVTPGDILELLITDNSTFTGTEFVTTVAGDTTATIASKFAALINEDIALAPHSVHATNLGGLLVITQPGAAGLSTSVSALLSGGATETIGNAGALTGGVNDALTFENMDNTVSGAGAIGQGNVLAVKNDAAGVINANGTHQLVIDTGDYTVINAGTIEATGKGGLLIESAVLNTGHLIANNSTLEIADPASAFGGVTGFGGAQIVGTGILDFEAHFVFQDITFAAGSKGELKLGHSETYSGRILGFGANTSQSIDLEDINFAGASRSWTPSGNNLEGVLQVTDGTHTANLTLVGHYVTGNFTLHDDGSGHVLVTDPPVHGHSDLLLH